LNAPVVDHERGRRDEEAGREDGAPEDADEQSLADLGVALGQVPGQALGSSRKGFENVNKVKLEAILSYTYECK
jgi:hypothetical protein